MTRGGWINGPPFRLLSEGTLSGLRVEGNSMVGSLNREALQIAEAVAREKGIDPEEVLQAMEEAIQKIGRAKYGYENDIRASIDRKTGDVRLERHQQVVELLEDPSKQITLEEAQARDHSLQIGDFLVEKLPNVEFGRVAAQAARQVISGRVRLAERARQYEEFKNRIGEVITGTVKRAEYGNYTVDIGKTEAMLRRDECIPRENLRPGDRIRCYIMDVRPEARGHQIFLSRAHPNFMAKLFMQEVPEIYDGTIQILSVARDPGSRAKIAVHSKDSSIDPVGACVGMRGSRVQAVVNELQGEKVDIVLWSPDLAAYILNAMAPAEISKVVIDESANRVDIVVAEDQQSLAIGRRGQNVRLASLLTGYDISILTEAQEMERRNSEFQERIGLFKTALDVEEVIAHLLVVEEFTNLEELAAASLEELASIEGFDEGLAAEIKSRAEVYLKAQEAQLEKKCLALGMAADLMAVQELSLKQLEKLGESGVLKLDDLADLSSDELLDILGEKAFSAAEADQIIMGARAHWFEEDNTSASAPQGN